LGSKHVSSFNSSHTICLKDRCLDRLYNVLFVYFDLYANYDYSFSIIRTPKYYELIFKTSGGGL